MTSGVLREIPETTLVNTKNRGKRTLQVEETVGAVSAATRTKTAGAEGGREQVTEVAPGARGWKCT